MLLARRPDSIFMSDFEQRRSTLSRRSVKALDQGEEPKSPGHASGDGVVLTPAVAH
jgi:hypothetical protein